MDSASSVRGRASKLGPLGVSRARAHRGRASLEEGIRIARRFSGIETSWGWNGGSVGQAAFGSSSSGDGEGLLAGGVSVGAAAAIFSSSASPPDLALAGLLVLEQAPHVGAVPGVEQLGRGVDRLEQLDQLGGEAELGRGDDPASAGLEDCPAR